MVVSLERAQGINKNPSTNSIITVAAEVGLFLK